MATISIETAEKELATLIERARQGEDIVIADGSGPMARLQPVVTKPSYRGRGLLKGQIDVSDDDLFGPLPDDELKRWYGEGDGK